LFHLFALRDVLVLLFQIVSLPDKLFFVLSQSIKHTAHLLLTTSSILLL